MFKLVVHLKRSYLIAIFYYVKNPTDISLL